MRPEQHRHQAQQVVVEVDACQVLGVIELLVNQRHQTHAVLAFEQVSLRAFFALHVSGLQTEADWK